MNAVWVRRTEKERQMEEYYLLTFESTHAAISTEKLLKPAEVTIMPVPRFISASCGISVRIHPDKRKAGSARKNMRIIT